EIIRMSLRPAALTVPASDAHRRPSMSMVKPGSPMADAGPARQDRSRDDRELTEVDLLHAKIAALQRHNHMLRETLDTIDGSVVVFDAERRLLFANAACHEAFPPLPLDAALLEERYGQEVARSLAADVVE